MSKSPVISGFRWTLLTTLLRRVMTLILFYFVAKWLSREDLGVFREYSLILGLLTVLGSFSFDFNYVVERRRSLTALTALWQFSLLASIAGFLLLTFSSGWLGSLYKSETLAALLRWTSLFLVIELLRRAVRALAARQLQFRELALAETYNVLFYSLLTIVLLYFSRSVLLFVIAFYLGNLFELIYLWKLNAKAVSAVLRSRINKLGIMTSSFRHLRGFLSQATLVSVVNLFSGNAPVLILGALLDPVSIGLFYFASQLVGVPVGMFTGAVNQVLFPVFAGKQDGDIGVMAQRYLRQAGMVGLPVLLLFCYVMMYLTGWLFGDKWSEAVPLIPAMFLLYGTSLYVNPLSGIPFIRRKPGWELVWNLVSLTVKVGAMLWGLQVSFAIAVWYFSLAAAFTHLAFYLMAMLIIRADLLRQAFELVLSLLPSLVFASALYHLSFLESGYALPSAAVLLIVILVTSDLLTRGKLRSDLRLLLFNKSE
jgi:O-antigen/teichoic acid export membrane protein